MSCKYSKAWIGRCDKDCDGDYCVKHINEKCIICHNQATHECDNTHFLVCGTPLCDNPLCDTIHEVMAHGWDLDKFMKWTGRKHTDSEKDYIKKFIEDKEEEYRQIIEKFKQSIRKSVNE